MSEVKYNWNAEDYRNNSPEQTKWAVELMSKLNLKGNEILLDIGCGDGRITNEISKLLPEGKAVGIDNSEAMIHLASGTFPNEKYPNLEFIVMEATEINFNYQFDVIFSSAALHWVKDHRALLSGVSNCLKPGGRILFQMGGKENAKKIFRVSDEIIAKPKWIKYFNNFEFPVYFQADDVYGLMLIDAGIKPLRVEIISRDMAYKDKHGLAAWIRSTWMPFYQRVPDDFKEKFIYEIVDTYLLNNPPEPDGIVHVGMKRLEVEGEKG